MAAELELVFDRPECSVAAMPWLAVGLFHRSFDAATTRALGRAFAGMLKRHPGGYVTLNLCLTDKLAVSTYADAEIRRELGALVDAARAPNAETLVVLEGGGFAVAALRSVMVSLGMVLQRRAALRFFRSVEEAVEWVHRESAHRKGVPERAEVLRQIAALRKHAGVSA